MREFKGGSEALQRAYLVAQTAHAGQLRGDGEPYLGHPLAVCEFLSAAGADEQVLVAALMHDAVEDSELTVEDVNVGFGPAVGGLVAALTEDGTISEWEARKDALRAQVAAAGETAAMIYAADKLTNLQEMRRIYAIHGEDAIHLHNAPTLDLRVAAWARDLAMLREVGADLELLDALAHELEAFECVRGALRA